MEAGPTCMFHQFIRLVLLATPAPPPPPNHPTPFHASATMAVAMRANIKRQYLQLDSEILILGAGCGSKTGENCAYVCVWFFFSLHSSPTNTYLVKGQIALGGKGGKRLVREILQGTFTWLANSVRICSWADEAWAIIIPGTGIRRLCWL